MYILLLLIAMAFVALMIVGAINRAQEQARLQRLQQRKLKIQVDALFDMVICLEQTVPNPLIAKLINDEAIILLKRILQLEKGPGAHLHTSITIASQHSEELISGKIPLNTSYLKETDAQINHTQVQLTETAKVLSHLGSKGTISETELNTYIGELTWAYLMVGVISFIGQGNKFMEKNARLQAQNYYQKAQQLLMESNHTNPRRLRMIKELSEMLEGSRKSMSWDLMPEHTTPL